MVLDTAVDEAENKVEVEIKEGCLRESKRNRNSVYAVSKRAFDICASAVAIILLSPVLLIISAIVYLGDPGPASDREERKSVQDVEIQKHVQKCR